MPGCVCCVPLCKSNGITNKKIGDQVRFFTFPRDPVLRKEWLRRCFQDENIDPINKRICSKHFSLEDYEDVVEAKIMNRLPRALKRNSVPSLNLKPPKKIHIQPTKRISIERAAKKKQREFIKQILENEKKEKDELEEDESDDEVNEKNVNPKPMTEAERLDALDRKISEFMSSKVQIIVAQEI